MSTRTGWPLLLLLGVSAALAPACDRPESDATAADDLRTALLNVICDTYEFDTLAQRLYTRSEREAGVIALADRDLVKSEMHDCQRLVRLSRTADGTTSSDAAGSDAVDAVDAGSDAADREAADPPSGSSGGPGAQAGGTRLMSPELGPRVGLFVSSTAVQSPNFTNGVVVAEIINYDTLYAPLGIETGRNCLWIRNDGAGPSGPDWKAAIIRPGGPSCNGAAPDGSTDVSRLQVRRMQLAGSGSSPARYPSTGRWMMDMEEGVQFIGIRCGNAWCEIGRPGFTSTTQLTDDPASVPGWGDEQLLSYLHGDSLKLSRLVGRILPVRRAEELPEEGFAPPGRRAATVTLSGKDPAARAAYVTKLGFDTIPAGDVTEHSLVLQRRGADDWAISGDRRAADAVDNPGQPAPSGVPWWNIIRSKHAHAGRRAARWAWSDDDEGSWIGCPQGCCKSGGPKAES